MSVARFGGLTLACMLPSLQLPRTFITTLAGKALMTVRRGASVGPLWLIILSADKESFPQDRYRRSGQSDFRRHPGEPRHGYIMMSPLLASGSTPSYNERKPTRACMGGLSRKWSIRPL